MIESETTELMDYVVYRLPHFGVNRRCDSNKGDPQLCLGRGGVNVYLRDCLSECCFCLIIVHLVLKTANSWSTSWLEICNVIVHVLLTVWDKIASIDPCTLLHSLVISTSHSWFVLFDL